MAVHRQPEALLAMEQTTCPVWPVASLTNQMRGQASDPGGREAVVGYTRLTFLSEWGPKTGWSRRWERAVSVRFGGHYPPGASQKPTKPSLPHHQTIPTRPADLGSGSGWWCCLRESSLPGQFLGTKWSSWLGENTESLGQLKPVTPHYSAIQRVHASNSACSHIPLKC